MDLVVGHKEKEAYCVQGFPHSTNLDGPGKFQRPMFAHYKNLYLFQEVVNHFRVFQCHAVSRDEPEFEQ